MQELIKFTSSLYCFLSPYLNRIASQIVMLSGNNVIHKIKSRFVTSVTPHNKVMKLTERNPPFFTAIAKPQFITALHSLRFSL